VTLRIEVESRPADIRDAGLGAWRLPSKESRICRRKGHHNCLFSVDKNVEGAYFGTFFRSSTKDLLIYMATACALSPNSSGKSASTLALLRTNGRSIFILRAMGPTH